MPAVVAGAIAYLIPATAATAVTVGATAISYATLIGYAATSGASVAYGSAQAAKADEIYSIIPDFCGFLLLFLLPRFFLL